MRPAVPARRAVVAALAAALAALAALLAAQPTGATVPPRNCGKMTVKSARYQVKADQIKCSTARPYARDYLARGRKPRGYTCRRFSRDTALAFRCTRRVKVFFAIRR